MTSCADLVDKFIFKDRAKGRKEYNFMILLIIKILLKNASFHKNVAKCNIIFLSKFIFGISICYNNVTADRMCVAQRNE